MKKIQFFSLLMAGLLALITVVAGCKKVTKDEKEAEDLTTNHASAVYEFDTSVETMALIDFTLTWLDADGKEQKELITQKETKKVVEFKTLPAKYSFKVTAEKKPGTSVTVKTDLYAAAGYSIKAVVNGKQTDIAAKSISILDMFPFASVETDIALAAQLLLFDERMSLQGYNISGTITAD
jgi:hypothetical protein